MACFRIFFGSIEESEIAQGFANARCTHLAGIQENQPSRIMFAADSLRSRLNMALNTK